MENDLDTVEFIETRQKLNRVLLPDRFQYRPEKGWAWLQRVCFWFLRRRNCNVVEEQVTYTRHTVDTANALHAIAKQRAGLLQHYNHEGERVLIGAEDFAQLMSSPEISNMVSFTASYRDGPQVMGMRITVLPWMRGILVLPRL